MDRIILQNNMIHQNAENVLLLLEIGLLQNGNDAHIIKEAMR